MSVSQCAGNEDYIGDIEDAPWAAAHAEAEARGDSMYVDPGTHYSVFTSVGLEAQGKCCGRSCRHCPFAHANVRPAMRKSIPKRVIHIALRGKAGPNNPLPTPLDVAPWAAKCPPSAAVARAVGSGSKRVAALVLFDPREGGAVVGGRGAVLHDAIDAARAAGATDVIAAPAPGVRAWSDEGAERAVAAALGAARASGGLMYGAEEDSDPVEWGAQRQRNSSDDFGAAPNKFRAMHLHGVA